MQPNKRNWLFFYYNSYTKSTIAILVVAKLAAWLIQINHIMME